MFLLADITLRLDEDSFLWLLSEWSTCSFLLSFLPKEVSFLWRAALVEEQNLLVEENIAPVGIFDDGIKEEVVDDGNNRWSFVKDRGYPSSIL